MKYFISSDIHSYYNEWKEALDNKGFDINNNEHVIVVLGDLFDRGEQHQQIIDFLLSLPVERTILIKGNHEDLLDTLVKRGYPLQHDISNGTYATLMELCKLPYRAFDTNQVTELLTQCRYYTLRDRMVDYYELDNYIFVHGWIPVTPVKEYIKTSYYPSCEFEYNPDWRNATEQEWEDARWRNGMHMWQQGIKEPNKTILCGHWHCSWGWSHIRQERKEFPNMGEPERALKSFEPFIDDGIMAIDACTAYSHIVNCVVI